MLFNKFYLLSIPIVIYLSLINIVNRKYNREFSALLPSFLAHIIKTLISFFTHKKKYKRYNKVAIMTITYELQNFLILRYARLLTPIYATICFQSKFIFFCILSIIILKKKYKILQYIGLPIIFCGILCGGIKKNNEELPLNIPACTGAVISSLCASFGSVYFEKYIRREIKDFIGYQFIFELVSTFLSFFLFCSEFLFKEIDLIENLKDIYLYFLIILTVFGTVLISFLATKICPVQRTVFTILMTISGSLISQVFLGEEIKINSLISLFIVSIGIGFFEYKNILKLFTGEDGKA